MTDDERRIGIANENALEWAVRLGMPGEDKTETLGRAQAFRDFILTVDRNSTADSKQP